MATPDTYVCSLCNSVHPQFPAWTPYNPDQPPIPVMVCQTPEYANSPYGPPPVYEALTLQSHEGMGSPPTYSAALFDALGERISRLREQLNTAREDSTFPARKDLETSTPYATAFVRSHREEGMRLEHSIRERPTHSRASRSLPPELWSLDELLHRARLRPTPREQTRLPPRGRLAPSPRENVPAPDRPAVRISPRDGLPPATKPDPRSRHEHDHYDRAANFEDNIKLICEGVSWLSKQVVKVSRLVKSKYQQRRQQKPQRPSSNMNGEGR